ncbi:MAG: hypothetical protein JSW12_18755, partial [Deltaproteobacteria bacterium]
GEHKNKDGVLAESLAAINGQQGGDCGKTQLQSRKMSKGNICTLARRSSCPPFLWRTGGPAHFANLVFKCIHLDELFNLVKDVPKFLLQTLSIDTQPPLSYIALVQDQGAATIIELR